MSETYNIVAQAHVKSTSKYFIEHQARIIIVTVIIISYVCCE